MIDAIEEVPHLPATSIRRFLKDYEWKLKPVILNAATAQWRAREKWTPDYFSTELGELKVNVKGGEYIKGGDATSGTEWKMKDLMAAIGSSSLEKPGPYLWDTYIEDLPGHFEEIQPLPGGGAGWLSSKLLPGGPRKRRGIPELLIAGAGTNFPFLHYDIGHDHAYIIQVRGEKIFWLYPPEQTAFMYPKEYEAHLSQIGNIHAVDLQRFPLFAKAQPMKAVVREGEAIFLPAGWWHCTQVVSTSIAIRISSLSRSNWTTFCNDRLSYTRTQQPLKTWLKACAYKMLGVYLRLQDLSKKVPAISKAEAV